MNRDHKRVFVGLASVNLAFVGIWLASTWLRLPAPVQWLFDLNAESTLPSWYNASILLLGGLLLAESGRVARRADKGLGRLLLLTGVVCIYLSADEAAAIHEKITQGLKYYPSFPRFSGNHGIWIPVYASAAAVFGIASFSIWRRLWCIERRGTGLLLAGAAVMAVAVAIEIIGYGELRQPENWKAYRLQVAFEEGFEMFGSTFLLLGAAGILTAVRTAPDARSAAGNLR